LLLSTFLDDLLSFVDAILYTTAVQLMWTYCISHTVFELLTHKARK